MNLSGEGMVRHVSQNNEIIARILRELDNKSESLRQAAAEISDLRGRVKLLQNENGILKRQAMREEDELVSLVQREVESMTPRELRDKIAQMAQLYKMERSRNRELDRTIQVMEPQVSNTMQLNSVIAAQKNTIQSLNERAERLTKDYERVGVYKDTIRKQEKVISKLEKVMREGMEEVRVARQNKLELEELRKRDMGQRMVGSRHGSDRA